MQGLRCGSSRPPVPEQRLINRLHAEKMKRRKDAAEAKVERKRKRKARHDKAEEDEEEASDAEDHALRSDGEGARASPLRSTCGTKKRERPWLQRSRGP